MGAKLLLQLQLKASTTTRHVILNAVKNLLANSRETLHFAQGDIDKQRSNAVQQEVLL